MPVRRIGHERGSGSKGIGAERLADDFLKGRYCFENFSQEPFNTKAGILLAPGGTALQACLINTGNYTFQWATTADETDQFYPTLGTDGGYNFQIATTPVLADGVEINFGGDVAAHPRNFTAGEKFFARVLINVTDASGADLTFGVKKTAATVATLTEITDLLAIRTVGNSASTDTVWTVLTNLNNGGSTDYTATSVTLTGLEDLTAVELEVRGNELRQGFLFVNGVPVPGAPAFTFDSGDSLSPIFRAAQTTDTTAAIKVFAFECGLIESRRPESLVTLASATA